MPSAAFDAILNEAIDDILAHGFDSQERVDRWMIRLRDAARTSMISAESLEQRLRDGLTQRYRKMVDGGEILRLNPGIERFTLDRIKPQLRSELDRRIMASANLIRLNRDQAIDKTLQRFAGWSTSIPKGGVSAESKRDVKRNAKKALASLPFEERRVLIDQGHKLISAINEIVASDGGAIAGRWRSHWRQAGYNYREDHKERDDKVYLVRDSWAHRAGLVKPAGNPYYDEITAAGQEPFCRCWIVWAYSLRELPQDMLTAKGRASLETARARTDDAGTARADARIEETKLVDLDEATLAALAEAAARDRMGWLAGLRRVVMVPDRDQWNAQYDDARDEIELQAKFSKLSPDAKVQTLVHEIGHRGQSLEPKLFARFRRAHLDRLSAFASMANPVHVEDFERRGVVDGGVAAEVFAESYSRAMTGRPAPADLLEFWRVEVARRRQLSPKRQVDYIDVWRNPITRCQRCSMYLPVSARAQGNSCTAVAGEISAHGHCRLFEIAGAADRRPAVGFEADRLRIERIRSIVR